MPGPDYHIVTNRTSYGETIQRQFPRFVTLVDDGSHETAGTGDLLDHPATAEALAKVKEASGLAPYILIFKNTARIEPIVHAHGWTLMNPTAAASEKVENKISQVMWLGSLERFLPQHRIEFMKNVTWIGKPFVLQWAHGHTGGGTILIRSAAELDELKARFPERRCRVTEYIEGPSFTMNVVVTPDRIIPSSVSYQITGMKPFTDMPFATVGNDWSLPARLLTAEDRMIMQGLAADLGAKMQKEYWRGLFGIDVIKDSASGKLYLIELNARQPASTTFESELQMAKREAGAPDAKDGMTTFEAHLAALLGEPVTRPLIPVTDGAQIVQRVTSAVKSIPPDALGTLELQGFKAIPYDNTDMNADLVRIQSKTGIMESHGRLNESGILIQTSLA
jgi:hypothetical protein